MSTAVEDILKNLERLAAGEISLEQFLETTGGRHVWLPSLRSYHQTKRYRAIVAFPSRDYKVIVRHFGVSIGVVYRAWAWEREQNAS